MSNYRFINAENINKCQLFTRNINYTNILNEMILLNNYHINYKIINTLDRYYNHTIFKHLDYLNLHISVPNNYKLKYNKLKLIKKLKKLLNYKKKI